jgi:hypothetical protein
MKTYLIRYLPIQWTKDRPGAIELVVLALSKEAAKIHIPEKYSSCMVYETETA